MQKGKQSEDRTSAAQAVQVSVVRQQSADLPVSHAVITELFDSCYK